MNPDPLLENIRARIHLHGILAGMEELVRIDPESVSLAAKDVFGLVLAVRGGQAASLEFDGKGVRHFPHAIAGADARLLFWSDRHLNRTFDQAPRTAPPLPLRGLLKPGRFKKFDLLGKRLEKLLRTPPDPSSSAAMRDYVRLSLRIAAGSLAVIAEHDPVAGKWMEAWPGGLAAFFDPAGVPLAWIECRARHVESGMEAPPREPDVRIQFRDWPTAVEALDGVLENTSAVALGRVKVDGLVPLADKLGLVLERIQHFVSR